MAHTPRATPHARAPPRERTAARKLCHTAGQPLSREGPARALSSSTPPPRSAAAMPWESLPPLVIITTAVALMGGIQQGVHRLYAGKPKPVGADTWDRLLEKRDADIKAGGPQVRARAAPRARVAARGRPARRRAGAAAWP
jgi:hypothetical protein